MRDKKQAGRARLRDKRKQRWVGAGVAPVSRKKVNAKLYAGINLDEPAFAPISDDLM